MWAKATNSSQREWFRMKTVIPLPHCRLHQVCIELIYREHLSEVSINYKVPGRSNFSVTVDVTISVVWPWGLAALWPVWRWSRPAKPRCTALAPPCSHPLPGCPLFQPRSRFLLGFLFLVIFCRSQQTPGKNLAVSISGPADPMVSYSTLLFYWESSPRQYTHTEPWLCSNTSSFTKKKKNRPISILSYVFFYNFCSFKIDLKAFDHLS